METTTHNEVLALESFTKTNVLSTLNKLITINSNLFASNAKREAFTQLITDLLAPQRVRNDNPYLYDENGLVTDIKCNRYNQYLPVEYFPAPIDGKYKTTSKIASWLYNELEKGIKAIEAQTMQNIFAGVAVDTNLVKSEIDALRLQQKNGYTNFDSDLISWENREGKRLSK